MKTLKLPQIYENTYILKAILCLEPYNNEKAPYYVHGKMKTALNIKSQVLATTVMAGKLSFYVNLSCTVLYV